jgi:hypothetical protein
LVFTCLSVVTMIFRLGMLIGGTLTHCDYYQQSSEREG